MVSKRNIPNIGFWLRRYGRKKSYRCMVECTPYFLLSINSLKRKSEYYTIVPYHQTFPATSDSVKKEFIKAILKDLHMITFFDSVVYIRDNDNTVPMNLIDKWQYK